MVQVTPSQSSGMLGRIFVLLIKITFRERRSPDAEKGVPNWCREWRAFLNHSAQCSARSVAWSVRPSLGADTENPFHIELERFPPRRGACGGQDRLRQEPCPNRRGGTCQRRCLAARRPQ